MTDDESMIEGLCWYGLIFMRYPNKLHGGTYSTDAAIRIIALETLNDQR